jgi:hypothetical protein
MQGQSQVMGGVEAFLRILLQAVRDDVLQTRRDLFPGRSQVSRLRFQDGRHGLGRTRTRKSTSARNHFIEHAA